MRKRAFFGLFGLGIWLISHVGMPCAVQADEQGPRALQIKTAFIYNFARYAEWPDGSFSAPDAPFVICLVGPTPLANYLIGLQSKTLHGRQVVVNQVSSEEISACHLAFLSPSFVKSGKALALEHRRAPILTVSEIPGASMIHLFYSDDTIRFEVNLKSASASGLKLSSQLLKVAQTVNQ